MLETTVWNKTNYHRIRIGVGRPDDPRYDISEFVLGKFSKEEEEVTMISIHKILDILPLLYEDKIEEFKKEISGIK